MSSSERRANALEGLRPFNQHLEAAERAASLSKQRRNRKYWWLVATSAALLLTLLTIAGVRLVTRRPLIADQVLIITVPSGADVTFDSIPLGQSPIKLEKVQAGMHKLEISKEGFEQIIQEVSISGPQSEPQVLEFKLRVKQ
jgi:hypothetical protein